MKVVCKHPVADFGGNVLFLVGKEYNIERELSGNQVMIKDEMGNFRWLIKNDKLFKEHFKIVKE